MTTMRAKMRVSAIKRYVDTNSGTQAGSTTQEDISFSAVYKTEGYPADGSDENNTFAKWTPMAEAKFSIMNPALFGKFDQGQEFYVDFTPAA